MLRFKRKLLAGILAASIALSASSGFVWSEGEGAAADAAPSDTASQGTEDADTGTDTGESEDIAAPVTEESSLAQMVLYAENENLALYVNEETCVFAVQNKKNNYYWWSTPYDYDSDPVAMVAQKNLLLSHFYYNAGDAAKQVSSYADSVKKGSGKANKIENGARFDYSFMKTEMVMSLYVTLYEDSFEVRMPVDEIIEDAADAATADVVYQLLHLDLMPSLGAASSAEEGYMLVPDGSGAVINFNNGKNADTGTLAYKAQVYGEDLAISREEAAAKTEQIYLPVIGMVKKGETEDNALVGVVTSGDSYAYVNANVSGQAATSYNNIWFSFRTRAADTYQIGTKEPLNVYEANGIKIDDMAVRYYVLNEDEMDIADLAAAYRNYLVKEKGLTAKTGSDDSALNVTFRGGTVKLQSVLGFPAELQTSATTYKEALEIIKELEGKGVDDMTVVYNDYSDGGIISQITSGVDYSNLLGGKNGFNELYGYIGDKNYELYPSVDFMEYGDSGKGYSFTLNASKRITKAYATQLAFMRNYGIPNTVTRSAWTILSPYYFPDLFRKLIESYTAEGIDTISLNQATKVLYSDFSRENFDGTPYFVRHDAQKILVDGYKALNDAGISILAQECNAYALPYVSKITNAPLYSSNYDLFDYDVPFYQMVIHGYVPYSSKPLNASSNEDELVLLSALTGSAPHYELIYSDPNKFTDSEYADYFYAHYSGWLDDAAQKYSILKDVVTKVSGQTITGYEILGAGHYRTTYSDGTKIEVNTDTLTISVDGKSINLADYELKGENE